jgi:predicted nucleic acid-binding protein
VRAAVDTNVLLYAEGLDDLARQNRAVEVLAQIPEGRLVIPVQVLAETFHVLVRKSTRPPTAIRAAIDEWALKGEVVDTSAAVLSSALDLSVAHQLSTWDAIVMAAAADAGCDLLLSEDLHAGFRWRGVTVVNPFAEPMSPLLDAFLDQGRG